MKIFSLDYWKEMLIDRFIKSYLKGFIDRIKGYATFTGILLFGLHVASVMLSSNEQASSILQMIIDAFGDVGSGAASSDDIKAVGSSLLVIFGVVMKLIKWAQGKPQVPTIVIKK